MNRQITLQIPHSTEMDALVERLQAKLEPLLAAFQPDLVQLQGRLVRHTSREGVTCRLNLHLPTGQLSSVHSAVTAQMAWRGASEDLLRQLHRHKQRLRETRPREHHGVNGVRPPALRPEVARALAARRADLAGYFGGHYGELLAFVRRQLAWSASGADGAAVRLDPEDVLDEVVLLALQAEPRELQQNRGRWLRLLAAAAVHRLEKNYGRREHGLDLAPLDADPRADGEPDPEQLAVLNEMMEQLSLALQHLPTAQRRDMILFMIEGFRPEELAQISSRSRHDVEASLRSAASTLSRQPRVPEFLRQRLRLGWEARPA